VLLGVTPSAAKGLPRTAAAVAAVSAKLGLGAPRRLGSGAAKPPRAAAVAAGVKVFAASPKMGVVMKVICCSDDTEHCTVALFWNTEAGGVELRLSWSVVEEWKRVTGAPSWSVVEEWKRDTGAPSMGSKARLGDGRDRRSRNGDAP